MAGNIINGKIWHSCYTSSSKIHGLGLFAGAVIPARNKIGSLSGVLVKNTLLPKKFSKNASISIVELDNGISLDARKFKNDLCFINHSCNPNCYMRIRGTEVEVYALKRISKHTELTMSYGETHHEGELPCMCKAPGCKGAI